MKSSLVAAISVLGSIAFLYPIGPQWDTYLYTFFALFLLHYVLVGAYNVFIYPFYISPLRHLPGPKNNHFFLGQAFRTFTSPGPSDLQLSWMRKWPEAPLIRYLTFANTEILLLNSVQACREVLQTQCYSFEKPSYYRRIIGEIVGIGLLMTEGEAHKTERRLLAGPFSLPSTKRVLPVFIDKAKQLSESIAKKVESDPEARIEAGKVLSGTTLDVIGLAGLGVELNSVSSKGASFHKCYRTIFNENSVGQIISALDMFVPVRKWLPLKANRDFVHANREVRRLLREVIRQRRDEIQEGGKINVAFSEENGRDLLTFMLHEKSEGRNPWNDEEVLNHLLNFMAAGHETSALTLTWCIYVLCMHQDVQNRLRSEMLTNIPQSRDDPTYNELENLPYLNNFLKEVLRLYAPSVIIPRTSTTALTICGTAIPKGTTFLLQPLPIHLNPTIWGPDAEEFKPERHEPENLEKYPLARDPYAMEAFNNGPRICIAKNFAMLEMKAILVELVRKWRFEGAWEGAEEGLGVGFQNAITLRPRGGVWVRARALGEDTK